MSETYDYQDGPANLKGDRKGTGMDKFDRNKLSSCYINFLFGAGVNGAAFPQVENFKKAMDFMKTAKPDLENEAFEKMIDKLEKEDRAEARRLFIEEFKEKEKQIDWDCQSIKNIKNMFRVTYRLIYESENRKEAMNQVNIFTANYDFIVEDSIKELGYLCNYVSASNVENNDKFFNIVGRDYSLKREVPTFLVSKIHGDISDPVLPGSDKFDSVLRVNKFEIFFKMKEKLSRYNSILFVIGYSGRDEHINRILKDCVEAGLTVYWFKYKEEDIIPNSIENKVVSIENEKTGDERMDTTELFAKRIYKDLWEESLEK